MKVISEEVTDRFAAYAGDCVEVIKGIPSNSIDYSIYSPPFASLYTYSNSERDMGNCKDYKEFKKHYQFLIPELYRVLKPGRNLSFHCMNLPVSKEREGYIGLKDFRGKLTRMMECCKRCGADDITECECVEGPLDAFIFHSEVTIWKNPVTAMQRTKALGLLYKQLRKDSSMSRQGIPDYLVTMRKPGINPDPVTKTHESFPVDLWQEYASPVWMDIDQSDTLQREPARDENDERHICALQLDVIHRGIRLWTKPNDLVLSPFMGIGSEGHEALKQGRRFIGIELKPSYFSVAVKNLRYAEHHANSQAEMFAMEQPA